MTKNFSIDPICVTMHGQEFCQFLSSTGVILLHNQNCVNEVFSLEKVYASGCSAKVQLIFLSHFIITKELEVRFVLCKGY